MPELLSRYHTSQLLLYLALRLWRNKTQSLSSEVSNTMCKGLLKNTLHSRPQSLGERDSPLGKNFYQSLLSNKIFCFLIINSSLINASGNKNNHFDQYVKASKCSFSLSLILKMYYSKKHKLTKMMSNVEGGKEGR